MLSQLMQINSIQEEIIREQAAIIDELYILVCQHVNINNVEGIEPLLETMKTAAERTELCRM